MNRIRVRAIIEVNGKILLVRNLSSPEFWCLPGGGVEPGEDIVSAIRRELIEETGVDPEIGNAIYVHQFEDENGFGYPEVFFHIKNGQDFLGLDITQTTHGEKELAEIGFRDITTLTVLPEFLKTELHELIAEKFSGPVRVKVIKQDSIA